MGGRREKRRKKPPWRRLRLPDGGNSNYTGKSIFNPISVPYRPRGSCEVEKVPEKFIPPILLGDTRLLRARRARLSISWRPPFFFGLSARAEKSFVQGVISHRSLAVNEVVSFFRHTNSEGIISLDFVPGELSFFFFLSVIIRVIAVVLSLIT